MWIKIIVASEYIPEDKIHSLADEADQLSKIIGSSIATANRRK